MTPPGGPRHDEASDEELLAAFTAGDEGAFSELVARYQRRVFGVCRQYFGNDADAEDAAQDAFVALYRRADTFAGTARFSTWMYRVATNACNDLARKRARRPQSDGTDPTTLREAGPDVIAQRELGLELAQALATLDPQHREAVVAHTVEGVPYHEIAERAGVPVGTIKSRVHRGHARLAVALAHLRDTQPSDARPPPTA